jgi:elongation factor P
MIDVNQLRKGVIYEWDNALWKVIDFWHIKMGRGKAVIRTKARNLRTGSTVEHTFDSGDRVQNATLETVQVQYLYTEGDLCYFMNLETYDQPVINKSVLGEQWWYLKDGTTVKIVQYGEEPLDIELPVTVDLLVTEAGVAVRGDTSGNVQKLARTETGLEVSVPAFVNTGDTVRVDTRDGSYVTRV